MTTPSGPPPRKTPGLTLVLGLAVAVAAVWAGVAFQGAARSTPTCAEATPTPGFPGRSGPESCTLPELALERLDAPGVMRLSALRGRPAVVNFWASWCAPCAKEMPVFARAAADLQGRVAFVGIDVQDRPEPALALARATSVAYPLLDDPRGVLYDAVRGAGMPTTLLVDPEGRVVYRRTGEVDAAGLAALLDEHLSIAWRPPPTR